MECRVEFDYSAQEDDELSLKKGDIIMNVVQKMDGWWEGSLNGKKGMFPDNFVKVIERKPSIPVPSLPVEPVVQKPAEPQTNNVVLRSNSNKSSRRLKALFSYCPEQDDELRLDVGDVLEYIAEVEEGWWRGRLRGKIGIFPSNFVSDLDTTSSSTNGKIEPEQQGKQNDLSKQSKAASRVPDIIPPAPPTSEPPSMEDDEDEPPPILPPKPVREQARCFYSYQAHNEDELTLCEGDIITIISKNCDDEGWWRGECKGKTGCFPDNFVRIISANEASAAGNKSSSTTTTPINNSSMAQGPKISPQERTNLIGVKPINSGVVGLERSTSSGSDQGSFKKTNGTSNNNNNDSIDGIGSSKAKQQKDDGGNDSVSKKVQRFSHMNLNPGMKPATPTSPVSSGGGSFSLPATMNSSRDQGDEEEDFNSIERGENKLSHLTAGRAKAPRRRPPSAIMTKDGEENGINGSYNHDSSIESPTSINHSTPYNLSQNNISLSQNNTPSNSILENSNMSENGDLPSGGGGSTGKSKKVPPWMAELKQKQDKKALNSSSPNTSVGLNATASPVAASPSSLPNVAATPSVAHHHQAIMDKDLAPQRTLSSSVKDLAPPLPAKPNTLATNSPSSIDKSPVTSPSTHNSSSGGGGAPPAVANRLTGKKLPAPGHFNANNNNNNSNNTNDIGGGGGDSKIYVSYEEHAKLRDRVMALEAELEAVRRQVKLLLDRELNHGHIV